MRLMVTGAAPVSATVLTFLRAALGCQVGDLPVAEGLGPRPSPEGWWWWGLPPRHVS